MPGDGIDGLVPALEDDPESDVRAMLAYYDDLTDDPGEVILPLDPPHGPADWQEFCVGLGATWLYSRELRAPKYVGNPEMALEYIREGPENA